MSISRCTVSSKKKVIIGFKKCKIDDKADVFTTKHQSNTRNTYLWNICNLFSLYTIYIVFVTFNLTK